MILSSGRFGIAPYRTPEELAGVLPLAIYLWLGGCLGLIYPTSDRAKPSSAVGFTPIRPIPGWIPPMGFPLWVDGRQWERYVVPALSDPRLSRWRGSVSIPPVTSPVVLDVDVNSPDMGQAVLDGVPLVQGVVIGETYSREASRVLYPTLMDTPQGLSAFLDVTRGVLLSYIMASSIRVNRNEVTAVIRIGDHALTPTNGPRTPGGSDYTAVGGFGVIVDSIVGAILDPANPFGGLVYPIRSPAIVGVVSLVSLGTSKVFVGTSDQSISVLGV